MARSYHKKLLQRLGVYPSPIYTVPMADSMRSRKSFPLLLAIAIAGLFSVAHMAIESDLFHYGPLSKRGFIHLLELKLLDLKFQLQPFHDSQRSKQILIAAVDEKGVEAFGLWPWSRAVIARLIDKVTQAKAKIIGFDAVFADQMNADNQSLWQLFLQLQQKLPSESQLLSTNQWLAQQQQLAPQLLQHPKFKSLLQLPLGRQLQQLQLDFQANTPVLKNALLQQQNLLQWFNKPQTANHPDQLLQQAIANSPITVLGYFHFYRAEEMVGIRQEEQAADKLRLLASGIRQLYRQQSRQMGEQTVQVVEPVTDLPLQALQLPTSVGAQTPLADFTNAAGPMGYFNVAPDPDGPMRRIHLLTKLEDQLLPSLSLLMAAKALDVAIQPLDSSFRSGLAIDGIALEPGNTIPTDGSGQMMVRYVADPVRVFPTYSVADILDPAFPIERLADQIILFGMTAQGLFDLRPTPFSATTPGVYIHASAIQNMLDNSYLTRPTGLFLLEIFCCFVLCCSLGLVMPILPILVTTCATLCVLIGYLCLDIWWLFPSGYWSWNVLPSCQLLCTMLAILLHSYLTQGREKQQIRQAFQFYLNKSVVDEMLKDTSKLRLGGERRVCTVLFSDVRGFTTISEQLSPEALVQLLNSYLTPMTNIVFQRNGTLDKYMGDAIMAFFGAPVAFPDHAKRACEAALDMMDALHQLQSQWRAKQWPTIDIGIGINTGMMAVGNMGSETRFDYTVMGDNVNLGSRLEGITKIYGAHIILSEMTYQQVKDHFYARQLDGVRVKGKLEPVAIYELLGRGQASPAEQLWLSAFEQARQHYQAQEFGPAKALFEQLHTQLKPQDPTSKLYLERIAELEIHPPPKDWDGIYVMKTK